jgi:hypothetical protein
MLSYTQLKQAHERAEFALARRREDELQIERQAKEIIELRRRLEVLTTFPISRSRCTFAILEVSFSRGLVLSL